MENQIVPSRFSHPRLPQACGRCGPILTIVLMLALLCLASPAQAVLFRVGPLDEPSPPGNGFPAWYQDTQGRVLDLCLPKNQAQLDAGVCLILPAAQGGVDLPLV